MRLRLLVAAFALFLILVHLNLRPPHKKTVVFVGTSFTRSIFFESIKFVHDKDEYTPWADSVMLGRINHVLGDTPADLVVLGSAEWGTNKCLKNVTTREGQVAHFYDDFLAHIPANKRLFVHNTGYNRSTKAMWDYYKNMTGWSVYDMAPLLREMGSSNRGGHGYYGYGTQVMFKHVMSLL